jgi:hypothetical protein
MKLNSHVIFAQSSDFYLFLKSAKYFVNIIYIFSRLTAFSQAGRIETNHSFSSANLFPFDEFHELFLPKKHNLFELDYKEFKDLMYLPLEWFARTRKQNPGLKYPVIMWDFLYKAGASQIHPHS